MNGFYFLTFIIGVFTFSFGLGIGWSMRGNVKEQELQKFGVIQEDITKLGWKVDDLVKKVNK